MHALATIARRLPEVSEGLACAGTALESHTFQVGGKAFLFLSAKVARLKLGNSAAEAKECGCEVGANGWVKLALDTLPPAAVLKRWVAESHGLLGGRGSGAAVPRRAPAASRKGKVRGAGAGRAKA